jgi:CRP/FNR family transcriptional regulator, anaerobic regulatory protein
MAHWLDQFKGFPPAFLQELEAHGVEKFFSAGEKIIREGQYIKVVPVVLSGMIKVFTSYEEKELLLYYIEAGQSCIMSFHAVMQQGSSKVFAVAEEDSHLLLLPADKMQFWMQEYPMLSQFFFRLYNERYVALLEAIQHLLYNRMDERLYSYLLEKKRLRQSDTIQLRHRQIAAELGTAREVITRVLKKLELDGKVRQTERGIEIL